jgi:hypothetical protein
MGGAWTTADFALIISLCSAFVSLLSLGWNIWSKFILPKGRLAVMFSTTTMGLDKDDHIRIEAVNFGPTDLVINAPVMPTKRRSILSSKQSWWSLKHGTRKIVGGRRLLEDDDWPIKLSPGESFFVYVSISSFKLGMEKNALGIGFIDTFQRFHEIPNKGFAVMMDRVKKL